ncbi:unnamed protein product [Adineta steineri]|nr:unnamed protein product [Adineta steineri]
MFTLYNDLQQIYYQDLFCNFRGYMGYVACFLLIYAYFLQAIHIYLIVIYPTDLLWQSAKFQFFLIILTWMAAFIFACPYIITNAIIYFVDDQICQLPLNLSFLAVYNLILYLYNTNKWYCIYLFECDGKIYILATISPSSTVIDETINILRYAGLAVTTTNTPQIKTPHLRHEIDELRKENARFKQELLLVRSNSVLSIHSTTSINSKTSLTSFYSGPSVLSKEQINNDEKLNIVEKEIFAQIENQYYQPKRQRLSEQPLHNISYILYFI